MNQLKQLSQRLERDPTLNMVSLMERFGRQPLYLEVDSASGPQIEIGGETRVNMGSNNYLGLTTDDRVVDAAIEAIRKWGTGVTGGRPLNGSLRLHIELENLISKFLGTEASLVCSTGYAANASVLCGLLGRGDRVAIDKEAHASILDGAVLSRSKMQRFEHNDYQHFQSLVESASDKPKMCIIEGAYSMQGDVPRVDKFADVCEEHNILLVVDEAHSLGVIGDTGAGACELYHCGDRVGLRTITFSKSLASCGGAVCGESKWIDAIKIRAKPFQYTASNTPASLATAHTSLQVLIENPHLMEELQLKVSFFKNCLTDRDISFQPSDSAIVTLLFGSDFSVLQIWKMLWNRGVFCHPAIGSSTGRDAGVLRMSLMRTHTHSQLEFVADSILECMKIMGLTENLDQEIKDGKATS